MTADRIVPHLVFERDAAKIAAWYCDIFPRSRVVGAGTLPGTPSGDAEVVAFDLAGQRFMATSVGPLFKPNPSISFILNFDPSREEDARKRLDATWAKLAEGGQTLMPLGAYPFSERYGWIEDRHGISWQLILTDPRGEPRPFVVPALLFTGRVAGRAEEAIRFYTSVFRNARTGALVRYPAGMPPEKEGTVMFADFQLEGQWFAAMDSAEAHAFEFNEGISLLVACDSQEEIDRYWEALSAVPEAEQCGWLKDRFGVSWQVNPTELTDAILHGTPAEVARVTQAFLPMKKFDLAALRRARSGP